MIFQVLPRVTGVIEEEWLHVLNMFKEYGDVWERGVAPLTLESSNQVFLERTDTICSGEEVSFGSVDCVCVGRWGQPVWSSKLIFTVLSFPYIISPSLWLPYIVPHCGLQPSP